MDLDGLGQDLLRVLAVREGLREDRVGARAGGRRGLLGVAVEAQVLGRELDALLRALAFAKMTGTVLLPIFSQICGNISTKFIRHVLKM